MPPTRSAVPAVLAATVGLLLSLLAVAVGAPGTATAAPAAPTAGDRVGAPKKGDCSAMTYRQATKSVAVAQVPCSRRHTTQVVKVGVLPGDLSWKRTPEKAASAANEGCGRAWKPYLGRSVRIEGSNQYDGFWFTPTDAKVERGARWYRCDVGILEDDGFAKRKGPMPQTRRPVQGAVLTCVTVKREFTTCADKHAFRTSHAFVVDDGISEEKYRRKATTICPRYVTSRRYLYAARRVGSKYVVICLSQTKR